MAAPTVAYIPSLEALGFYAERLSNCSSASSSLSTSPAFSSSRCTSFAECPGMSLTSSLSSDTLTENETPPESPRRDLQRTPIFLPDAMVQHGGDRPSVRPLQLLGHGLAFSEPEDEFEPDAGYDAECEGKRDSSPFGKRPVARRIPAGRRRGKPASPLPRQPSSSRDRLPSSTNTKTPAASPPPRRPPSPPAPKPPKKPRPSKIDLPPPPAAPHAFPPARHHRASIGLGIGFPASLSDARRAPPLAHRASTDVPPHTPLPRSVDLAAAAPPTDVAAPARVSIPSQPRLGSSASLSMEDMSPLALPSPLGVSGAPPPGAGGVRPSSSSSSSSSSTRSRARSAFCFAHESRGGPHAGANAAAAAVLTLANNAQLLPHSRSLPGGIGPDLSSSSSSSSSPSSSSSSSSSPEEEVRRGDVARGIRRYESFNPYFPAMGYRVISG